MDKFKDGEWLKLDELREVFLIGAGNNIINTHMTILKDGQKKFLNAEEVYNLLCDGIKFRELKKARMINREIEIETEKIVKEIEEKKLKK